MHALPPPTSPKPVRRRGRRGPEWPRKTLFTTGLFVLLWLSFSAWLRSESCALSPSLRMWLELANGATWPEHWPVLCNQNAGHFVLVLGARTALNFAGPLLVIAAGIWFVTGGLERLMLMNRDELMRQLSAELVASLYSVVRLRHPGTDPKHMSDELREMEAVANSVVDGFLRDVKQREARERGRVRTD